jgi:hypothetical protein
LLELNKQRSVMRRTISQMLSILGVLVVTFSPLALGGEQTKTTSMKGKVFRSDTNQTIPNASIVLLDEKKSEKQDNSIDTKSDDQGNYSFENVVAGVYTVSIQAWYPTKEDAPCQLLIAKTVDKNSTVMVAREKDKFVQQVFIKGFSIRSGKEFTKNFDFACKSMFAK